MSAQTLCLSGNCDAIRMYEGNTEVNPGFPGGSVGKEPACRARDAGNTGSIPGSGRFPGGGHGNPLQYSCLENHSHGQRSLLG